MKNENQRTENAIKLLAILATLFFLWCATACKTVYVPVVETHETDSVRIETRVDTFYQHTHDSVRVQLPCSDSIEVAIIERWHTDTIREKSVQTDTVTVAQRDSVPQIVEVEKVVTENSPFARFCICYFFLSILLALITCIIYFAMKYYLRK